MTIHHEGDNRISRNSASWKSGSFTAKQLQSMEFPPTSWILLDIIPAEGVTLLCSKPKFGKSWLAYDLCIASTTDRFTLGAIKPAQGDVLYLALEDSKRRLHRRMRTLLPSFGRTWPEKLTLKTEWRRLHEGGLDDIRAWHSDTKSEGGRPILVVIDVLAKVRKPVGNRQLYESDYAALADLTKLANELGLAVVVLHHTRKMAADDLMETVSGSFGVSGAVDSILIMAMKTFGAVLDIRGRDLESVELAIEFNKNTCRWRVLGNATEVRVSKQRAKIMISLKEAGEPMEIASLLGTTGMKRNPLEVLLVPAFTEG
jgi:AAA domain